MSSLPTTTTAHVPTVVRPDPAAGRAGAPAVGGGLNLRQIWAMMLRHIWLILIVMVVVAAAAAGAYLLCLKYFTRYTARGSMILNEQISPGEGISQRITDRLEVQSQQTAAIMRITAEHNLQIMLNRPEARAQAWYRLHANDNRPMTEVLRDQLSVIPVRDSKLLEVRMTGENPAALAAMVNFIIAHFEDSSRSDVGEALRKQVTILNISITSRERLIGTRDRQLADLRAETDFEALGQARSRVIDRVTQLGQLFTTNELRVDEARRLAKSYEPLYNPTIPATPEALDEANLIALHQGYSQQLAGLAEQFRQRNSDRFADLQAVFASPEFLALPEVAAVRMRISEVELTSNLVRAVQRDQMLSTLVSRRHYHTEHMTRLLTRLDRNHPEVVQAQAGLDELNAAIREKQAELFATERDTLVRRAQGERDSAEKLLETIRKQLEEAQAERRRLEDRWAQYNSLVQERAVLEQEKKDLEARVQNIEMRSAMQTATLGLNARAAEPREISFPRWEMFVGLGAVLAVAMAIGLVLLIELGNSSVRTTRDISEQVRLPLLGVVPEITDANMTRKDMCRMVVRDPMSILAESFRQIRTNLLFSAPVDQLSSIAITSAARDEGKTTIAANLAITIALSGRRVLLVDANFRRPALDAAFALPATVGLSNVLTNQATLAEAAQSTDVPNLAVIVSGPTPPNPAELLGSATMRAFLDQADAEYDIVIFDTPPALLAGDAQTLATMVDGMVTVVRASATSRGMVARLRDEIYKVRGRIFGAILNAARPTRGGYFRKSQQQYAEYHNQLSE